MAFLTNLEGKQIAFENECFTDELVTTFEDPSQFEYKQIPDVISKGDVIYFGTHQLPYIDFVVMQISREISFYQPPFTSTFNLN